MKEVIRDAFFVVIVGMVCLFLGAGFGVYAGQMSIRSNCELIHGFHIEDKAYQCMPVVRP